MSFTAVESTAVSVNPRQSSNTLVRCGGIWRLTSLSLWAVLGYLGAVCLVHYGCVEAVLQCPTDSWLTVDDDRCFKVFHYRNEVSRERGSWSEAMGICAKYGASLATLHTPSEDRMAATLTDGINESCWIGLRKSLRRPHRGWLWVDSNTPLSDESFTRWGDDLKLIWRILPPDEKCSEIDNDGWGERACWGPTSRLGCFVCATPSISRPDEKHTISDIFMAGEFREGGGTEAVSDVATELETADSSSTTNGWGRHIFAQGLENVTSPSVAAHLLERADAMNAANGASMDSNNAVAVGDEVNESNTERLISQEESAPVLAEGDAADTLRDDITSEVTKQEAVTDVVSDVDDDTENAYAEDTSTSAASASAMEMTDLSSSTSVSATVESPAASDTPSVAEAFSKHSASAELNGMGMMAEEEEEEEEEEESIPFQWMTPVFNNDSNDQLDTSVLGLMKNGQDEDAAQETAAAATSEKADGNLNPSLNEVSNLAHANNENGRYVDGVRIQSMSGEFEEDYENTHSTDAATAGPREEEDVSGLARKGVEDGNLAGQTAGGANNDLDEFGNDKDEKDEISLNDDASLSTQEAKKTSILPISLSICGAAVTLLMCILCVTCGHRRWKKTRQGKNTKGENNGDSEATEVATRQDGGSVGSPRSNSTKQQQKGASLVNEECYGAALNDEDDSDCISGADSDTEYCESECESEVMMDIVKSPASPTASQGRAWIARTGNIAEAASRKLINQWSGIFESTVARVQKQGDSSSNNNDMGPVNAGECNEDIKHFANAKGEIVDCPVSGGEEDEIRDDTSNSSRQSSHPRLCSSLCPVQGYFGVC